MKTLITSVAAIRTGTTANAATREPPNRSIIMRTRLFALFLLVASVGCASSEAATREAELRATIAAFRASLNAGDSASFFALLAPDLEVFAPGTDPIRGAVAHESFRPLFTQLKPDIGPFTNEEITLRGDIAIQRHSFRLSTTPRSGGPMTTVVGSGLHVWKRTADGRWQMVKDIWTNPPR